MSKLLPLTLLLITLLALTACKTWYKPGADEEVLAADQQHCESETRASTGRIFLECMKRAGWHHTDMSAAGSDSEPVAPPVVEVETDTRGSTQPRQLGGWVQFGADTEQLEDAREQCGEADVSSESFNECMQRKGWHQLRIRISVEEPGELD